MMYSIGYDIGSSSIKAALVEVKSGKQVAVTQEPESEMEILSPQPNWAEQDPEQWWKWVCKCTQKLLQQTRIEACKVQSIGIAYQMHGLVVVDNAGIPLRNAIIWCDSRAVSVGQKAFEEIGQNICMQHILNSPANFTASKLKWVCDHEPHIYEKIHKFMLPGDYIAYKLSGQISTTMTGLSEGTLWDFKNNTPAFWLMNHYELDRGLIPDVVENFSNQGEVHQAAADLSGLQVGTPIYYRAGDQPNNAMSLNVLKPGEVAATGGTSGVIYALTDQIQTQEHERLNHFAHVNYTKDSPIIGKLLCINGSGVMYRWLKDTTSMLTYADMNQMAEQQPVGSKGLSVMPFGNGAERMLNNRVVGAHFLNLNLNVHDKASLCRATLEGIAFSFAYGLELLKADNAQVGVIKTGNDNLFQSQIFSETIATIIGHEIELYQTTGAVGAARASSLVEGGYHSLSEVMSKNVKVKNFTPNKDSESYMKAYYSWKKKLKFLLNNNQNP